MNVHLHTCGHIETDAQTVVRMEGQTDEQTVACTHASTWTLYTAEYFTSDNLLSQSLTECFYFTNHPYTRTGSLARTLG